MTRSQAKYQANELTRQTNVKHTYIKTKRFNLVMFMSGKSEKDSYILEWMITIK